MRGVVPALLIILVWAAAMSLCYYLMVFPDRSKSVDTSRGAVRPTLRSQHSTPHSNTSGYTLVSRAGAALLLSLSLTVTVNGLFSYSTQLSFSPLERFVIQLSMAAFRIFDSLLLIPILSHSIRDTPTNILFRFRLLSINDLIIPCLVTLLTSPKW